MAEDALRILINSGVVDKRVTLDDLAKLSASLDEIGGSVPNQGGTPAAMWSFFVKGKYVNRDDAPTPAPQK